MTLRNCRFLLGMAGQILKYRLHHLLPLELLNSRRLILMIKLLRGCYLPAATYQSN